MTSTTLNNVDNITDKAYPHNNSGLMTYRDLSGFAGGGNLRSNLSDLAKYVQAQINASNINSLGQAILQSQESTIQINLKDHFALGWEFYYTSTNKELIFKNGISPGFTAAIAFDKDTKKAIITLFNNFRTNNPGVRYLTLIEEYFK